MNKTAKELTDYNSRCRLLIEALVLSVIAPNDEACERAVELVGRFAAGLRRIDVQMCQLDAKRRLDRMNG